MSPLPKRVRLNFDDRVQTFESVTEWVESISWQLHTFTILRVNLGCSMCSVTNLENDDRGEWTCLLQRHGVTALQPPNYKNLWEPVHTKAMKTFIAHAGRQKRKHVKFSPNMSSKLTHTIYPNEQNRTTECTHQFSPAAIIIWWYVANHHWWLEVLRWKVDWKHRENTNTCTTHQVYLHCPMMFTNRHSAFGELGLVP